MIDLDVVRLSPCKWRNEKMMNVDVKTVLNGIYLSHNNENT